MSEQQPAKGDANPYSKGKSRIVAELVLQGKTNEEILQYISDNDLAKRYPPNGVTKRDIWMVRGDLRKNGVVDADGFPVKKEVALPQQAPPQQQESAPLGVAQEPTPPAFIRVPQWDKLTVEEVQHIADPEMRAKILNYKTDQEKYRQTFKPEYVTRGEVDLLRGEVSTRMGGVEEKINRLLELAQPIQEEEPEEPEEVEEEEEASPRKPPRVQLAVNRLQSEEAAEDTEPGDDDLIEVQTGVIIKKNIGFTAKSVMYYEIDRAGGFGGNLADYVNSCIEDAHKGRDIQLAVVEKRFVR